MIFFYFVAMHVLMMFEVDDEKCEWMMMKKYDRRVCACVCNHHDKWEIIFRANARTQVIYGWLDKESHFKSGIKKNSSFKWILSDFLVFCVSPEFIFSVEGKQRNLLRFFGKTIGMN